MGAICDLGLGCGIAVEGSGRGGVKSGDTNASRHAALGEEAEAATAEPAVAGDLPGDARCGGARRRVAAATRGVVGEEGERARSVDVLQNGPSSFPK